MGSRVGGSCLSPWTERRMLLSALLSKCQTFLLPNSSLLSPCYTELLCLLFLSSSLSLSFPVSVSLLYFNLSLLSLFVSVCFCPPSLCLLILSFSSNLYVPLPLVFLRPCLSVYLCPLLFHNFNPFFPYTTFFSSPVVHVLSYLSQKHFPSLSLFLCHF